MIRFVNIFISRKIWQKSYWIKKSRKIENKLIKAYQGSNSWMIDSNRMTANNREANPKMQHNANTTNTSNDFEPAGFIILLFPDFTEADIAVGHVALRDFRFGVGNRAAVAVGNSQNRILSSQQSIISTSHAVWRLENCDNLQLFPIENITKVKTLFRLFFQNYYLNN